MFSFSTWTINIARYFRAQRLLLVTEHGRYRWYQFQGSQSELEKEEPPSRILPKRSLRSSPISNQSLRFNSIVSLLKTGLYFY